MSRVDKWTLAVVLTIAAVYCPVRIWWDFHHPESWSPGTGDDPHVYLWAIAGTVMLCLYIAVRIVHLERIRKRRARRAALLIRAEALVRQHRRAEALAVLKECQDLLDKVKST